MSNDELRQWAGLYFTADRIIKLKRKCFEEKVVNSTFTCDVDKMINDLITVDNECIKIQQKKDDFELFLKRCDDRDKYVIKHYLFLRESAKHVAESIGVEERTVFRVVAAIRQRFTVYKRTKESQNARLEEAN